MNLKEILSIAGAAGLYKYVAQGKGGIIVESLLDGRRQIVSGSAKVSALGDIAMFTDAEEVALGDIFQTIFDANEGSKITIDNKSTPDDLAAFMESTLPNYDRERVHNSDIKKLASWYNILVGSGMSSFNAEDEGEETEESVAAKLKNESTPKPVIKNAVPKATTATSRTIVASKSTTGSKRGS